jgi:putative hydrolase of the HAD superfamily
MIKGIVFDFGNVICEFDNRKFIQKISKHSPHSKEYLYGKIYEMGGIVELYERGEISSSGFYERMKGKYDLDIGIEYFRDAFTDIFNPIHGTIELIRNLKGNYKLGLLSNTNEWDHEFAIKLVDIYPLFDAVTTSYEVGAKKPDERIYLDMLEKIGLGPRECIYIDDIKAYSDKASEMGMIGHQYRDNEGLMVFLEGYGIKL